MIRIHTLYVNETRNRRVETPCIRRRKSSVDGGELSKKFRSRRYCFTFGKNNCSRDGGLGRFAKNQFECWRIRCPLQTSHELLPLSHRIIAGGYARFSKKRFLRIVPCGVNLHILIGRHRLLFISRCWTDIDVLEVSVDGIRRSRRGAFSFLPLAIK